MARDDRVDRDHPHGLGEIEWELEPARSGAVALKLGGHYVESRYAPEKSAATAADGILSEVRVSGADFIVLVGGGLGYLIKRLQASPGPTLVVWDPFPDVRKQLLAAGQALPNSTRDSKRGKHRRKGAKLHYVSTPAELDIVLERLSPAHQHPHLAIHPGYSALCRFEVRYTSRALRRRFARKRALKLEDAIVSARSFRILRTLPFCRTIEDLGQSLAGHTAIIASSGPSLASACAPLARRRGGALFACVQALETLTSAKAHINFATCADPSDLFSVCKVDASISFDALLADTSSKPKMIEPRRERSFLFHLRTAHFHQIPWETCGLPVMDEPCLTVSEIGLLLAHSMGARRFILVGVDYNSSDPRYRERFTARDMAGNPAATNSHYFHGSRYMSFICSKWTQQGAEIYRLGSGLAIEGVRPIEIADLERLLADLPHYQGPIAMPWLSPERFEAVAEVAREAGSMPNPPGGGRKVNDDLHQFGPDFDPIDPAARYPEAVKCLRALDRGEVQYGVDSAKWSESSDRELQPPRLRSFDGVVATPDS